MSPFLPFPFYLTAAFAFVGFGSIADLRGLVGEFTGRGQSSRQGAGRQWRKTVRVYIFT